MTIYFVYKNLLSSFNLCPLKGTKLFTDLLEVLFTNKVFNEDFCQFSKTFICLIKKAAHGFARGSRSHYSK